jgi:hypothetical protein
MLAFCSPFWLTREDDRGDIAFNPIIRGEEFDVVDLHSLGSILIVALELFRSKLLEQ